VGEVSGQTVGHKVLDVFLFSTEVDDGSLSDVERRFGATVVLAEGSWEKTYHFLVVML
jgi:hypothetical protein